MNRVITARPLTAEAFAPFGDVIDKNARHQRIPINGGRARRLAPQGKAVATGDGAHVMLTVVEGDPYAFPLRLEMVERHPFGSQAFLPLSPAPFLVVVCPDQDGVPGTPCAFLTAPHQGVNYHRNTWHGVLTPLGAPQDFFVVDRGGEGVNLEEHWFSDPWIVQLDGPEA